MYSGHYARTSPGPDGDGSRPMLLEAADSNKDQTYFLCGVPREGLAKVGRRCPECHSLVTRVSLLRFAYVESVRLLAGRRRLGEGKHAGVWLRKSSNVARMRREALLCVHAKDALCREMKPARLRQNSLSSGSFPTGRVVVTRSVPPSEKLPVFFDDVDVATEHLCRK